MNQEDIQHIAMLLLELHINQGRLLREHARKDAELESLRPKPQPEPAPQEVPNA